VTDIIDRAAAYLSKMPAALSGSNGRGALTELPHGMAVGKIEAALSPFEPEGAWAE
jgi:hypothetical protein